MIDETLWRHRLQVKREIIEIYGDIITELRFELTELQQKYDQQVKHAQDADQRLLECEYDLDKLSEKLKT